MENTVSLMNQFSWNVFQNLSESAQPTQQNVFYSPFSLSMALFMLSVGVSNQTQSEILTTFGMTALIDLLNRKDEMDKSLKFADESANIFKYANALVKPARYPLKAEFESVLKNRFQAEAFEFTEKDPEIVKKVNDWVDQQTDHRIPKVLTEPPSADTVLMLLNTVFFKGTWKQPFSRESTTPGTFHGVNTKYENVSFMSTKKSFKIYNLEALDATLIELPYNDTTDVSFYAILPKRRESDLSEFKDKLTEELIDHATRNMITMRIKLRVPKLSFEVENNFEDILKASGMRKIFHGGDFTPMTDLPNVFVSKVKQIAQLEMDEEGTVASAVTVVQVNFKSVSIVPEYTFDHPFIFFIRNNVNRINLFIGQVQRF